MSSPTEPEKYNIDEMMDRLNRQGSKVADDEGQLVIRADGSEAIRVRKRKRRTKQDAKQKQERLRKLQLSGALIVLAFFVLLAIAIGGGTAYVNSLPFRKKLIKLGVVSTGAEVELRQFRMNPLGVNAGGIHFSWPKGKIIESLDLRGVKADLTLLNAFNDRIVGQEIRASLGTMSLQIPSKDIDGRLESVQWQDHSIQFHQCSVNQLKLHIQDAAGFAIQLRDSEATLLFPSQETLPQLLLSRGDLIVSGWPSFKLDHALIDFDGKLLKLAGMRLRHPSDPKGVIELKGSLAPYDFKNDSILSIQVESYQLAGLIGDEFSKFFSGRIDSVSNGEANELLVRSGSHSSISGSLVFASALGVPFEVSNFAFLNGLSVAVDDDWFVRPVFVRDVGGRIRHTDSKISLEQLNVISKGRLVIRGNVTLSSDHKLSGELQVGVAQAIIKNTMNGVLDKMFAPLSEGYRWISLDLGGTAAAPTDNFSELYEKAMTQKAEPKGVTVPSFEDLSSPR